MTERAKAIWELEVCFAPGKEHVRVNLIDKTGEPFAYFTLSRKMLDSFVKNLYTALEKAEKSTMN